MRGWIRSLPGNEKFITTANNYIDKGIATRIGANVFPARATVFAKVGAALLLNRRRMLTLPTIVDNNMMAATPTATDPDFLYHFLCSIDFEKYVQTGALPSVNQSALGSIPFPSILPAQQRRIAEILTTIDDAIAHTEALIAKTQQIKAGLMHNLFTRGVTPDGQLRPSRDEAPKLYKESPLGWIPREWEVRALRSCLLDNPTNGIYKPAQLIGRGALLVGQAAFTPERSVDFSLSRRAVISAEELQRYGLAADNILVSRVFATVDGVGQPALVPQLPEPAVYESNMVRLRVDHKAIRPRLLFEWLRGNQARQRIVGGANASNQTSVNQGILNPLPVLLQPLDEQDHLVGIIEGHDEEYATERRTLGKLQDVKRGLMHDLLTGRVRVPPTPP